MAATKSNRDAGRSTLACFNFVSKAAVIVGEVGIILIETRLLGERSWGSGEDERDEGRRDMVGETLCRGSGLSSWIELAEGEADVLLSRAEVYISYTLWRGSGRYDWILRFRGNRAAHKDWRARVLLLLDYNPLESTAQSPLRLPPCLPLSIN